MRPDAKHRAFQHSSNNRDNSGKSSYKLVRKEGFNEDSPTKETMRRHYGTWGRSRRLYDYKFIKNFLIGSVGKHWDNVYSELCRAIDVHSPGATSIHEDVLTWQIFLRVEERDGKVYSLSHHRWNRNQELCDKDLYVDSKGILRRYRRQPRKYTPYKPLVRYPITHTPFGDFIQCEGLWYRVKMVEPKFYEQEEKLWPGYGRKGQYTMAKDVILTLINDGNYSRYFYDKKRMYSYSGYSREELVSTYGEPKVCVSKLAANKSEIKKLKKLKQRTS